MNILQIDSSVLGDNSVSRSLTASIVADLVTRNPGAKVTVRDLDREAPAHLGNHLLPVLGGPKDGLNAVQQAELDRTETLLAEFMAADVLVIGAPQYNFSIPSQLKAWIDALAVPGKTFRYTPAGAQGLLGDKRVVIVSSQGGFYTPGTPMGAFEHQESHLSSFFRFLGVTDIQVVRAEGVKMGPEAGDRVQAALRQAAELEVA